ncbi:MAG: methyltransferase [Deltaproteobacteria bacterium]|nr:methyltransferase [Deltaproteobacteria bacterium]NCP02447.1 methyltransferase [Deltaproteobacteria bacterium]NCP77816.1 methyltransferase [Desulfuromonadales bacterium]
MIPFALTHIVGRAQQLLAEVLRPGDMALDLTAGNGCDTLFLVQQVGQSGCVLAFDVQQQALDQCLKRLSDHGIWCRQLFEPQALSPGVSLVRDDHAGVKAWCPLAPKAIIANLGFLPGGDKALVTRASSTVKALVCAAEILAPGGRLTVVVYPGHAGGAEEAEAVETFFGRLDAKGFSVLCLTPWNRQSSPYLLAAEKFTTG